MRGEIWWRDEFEVGNGKLGRWVEPWRRAVVGWVSAAIFVAYLHCLVGHAPVGWSAYRSTNVSSATDRRVDAADQRRAARPERSWVTWACWVLDPASGDSGPLQSTCHNESGCICRGAILSVPVMAPELSDLGIWLDAGDLPQTAGHLPLTAPFTVDHQRLSLAGDPEQAASRPWRSWHPVYRL
ncbi:MAG: hypothetical protein U0795_12350 [Pirellulales bacterium]